MKIIITESQFETLINESVNPCPEGKKEDPLITLDQLRKGSTLSKGYCNTNPKSAIVQIQILMQKKGLIDEKSYNGYYGDKTQKAVQSLFSPSIVDGTKIGSKTLGKLETNTIPAKKKTEPIKETPLNLFNSLSRDEKIIVSTLLGESGGESDPKKGMTAVANVLKNRSDDNHYKYGDTPAKQALAKSQFSMWNDYNRGNEVLQDVFDKFKNHNQMKTAINIAKSINNLNDITGGAKFYYANYVTPNWSKDTDTTKWVPTITIGNHKFGNVVNKKKK